MISASRPMISHAAPRPTCRTQRKGARAMPIKALNPYLMFDGTADKAIRHYEAALGAKVEHIQRFGDMGAQSKTPERIIHALVRIGAGVVMVSDARPGEAIP